MRTSVWGFCQWDVRKCQLDLWLVVPVLIIFYSNDTVKNNQNGHNQPQVKLALRILKYLSFYNVNTSFFYMFHSLESMALSSCVLRRVLRDTQLF